MRKLFFAVVALVVMVAGVLAQHVLREQALADRLPVNTHLGGGLGLDSTLGQPLTLASLHGRVVLLDFGYTSCPDICPTELARLRQLLRSLGPDAGRVAVVFVSIDPVRDTLDHLRQYLGFYDARFIGATGSEDAVAAVAKRYGAVYYRENEGAGGAYAYAHSDYIYLLDTEGRVRRLYDSQATSTTMQADVEALLPGPLDRLL